MSNKLSWKVLISGGVVVWLVGKAMDSVLGGAFALVGIIVFLMGVVDLVRSWKMGKVKTAEVTEATSSGGIIGKK